MGRVTQATGGALIMAVAASGRWRLSKHTCLAHWTARRGHRQDPPGGLSVVGPTGESQGASSSPGDVATSGPAVEASGTSSRRRGRTSAPRPSRAGRGLPLPGRPPPGGAPGRGQPIGRPHQDVPLAGQDAGPRPGRPRPAGRRRRPSGPGSPRSHATDSSACAGPASGRRRRGLRLVMGISRLRMSAIVVWTHAGRPFFVGTPSRVSSAAIAAERPPLARAAGGSRPRVRSSSRRAASVRPSSASRLAVGDLADPLALATACGPGPPGSARAIRSRSNSASTASIRKTILPAGRGRVDLLREAHQVGPGPVQPLGDGHGVPDRPGQPGEGVDDQDAPGPSRPRRGPPAGPAGCPPACPRSRRRRGRRPGRGPAPRPRTTARCVARCASRLTPSVA